MAAIFWYIFDHKMAKIFISPQELKRAISSLALGRLQHRVLQKEPKSKEIVPADEFSVNDQFSSKLIRVKIQTGGFNFLFRKQFFASVTPVLLLLQFTHATPRNPTEIPTHTQKNTTHAYSYIP